VVYLQEIEGGRRQTGADDPVAAHLGVVADSFEQPVGHSRGPRPHSQVDLVDNISEILPVRPDRTARSDRFTRDFGAIRRCATATRRIWLPRSMQTRPPDPPHKARPAPANPEPQRQTTLAPPHPPHLKADKPPCRHSRLVMSVTAVLRLAMPILRSTSAARRVGSGPAGAATRRGRRRSAWHGGELNASKRSHWPSTYWPCSDPDAGERERAVDISPRSAVERRRPCSSTPAEPSAQARRARQHRLVASG
jgi:hypothetical protein